MMKYKILTIYIVTMHFLGELNSSAIDILHQCKSADHFDLNSHRSVRFFFFVHTFCDQ